MPLTPAEERKRDKLTERETVIVANLADLDAGYFMIETTEPAVYRRLHRMAPTMRIEERRRNGKITGWTCYPPATLWRGAALRIAAKRHRHPKAPTESSPPPKTTT